MSENKGGRPRFEPTDKMRTVVSSLAGFMSPEQIGIIIGVSGKTIQRKFKKELAQGSDRIQALCVSTVIQNVQKGGSVGQRAAEFLLHTRYGWSKYAPPPVPKEPDVGKKEALNRAAETKHEETSWGDVVH